MVELLDWLWVRMLVFVGFLGSFKLKFFGFVL